MPPNSAPKPPPLVVGLGPSASAPVLGDVDLLVGVNASLSLPTGDGLLLMFAATSRVFACLRSRELSAEVAESTSVLASVAVESMDSEAIKGDERVR